MVTIFWRIDVIKRSKVKKGKVKGQGSKVKVISVIYVKERAGTLRPTSSCFILISLCADVL